MKADGANQMRLTSVADSGEGGDGGIAWSPDGSLIAFNTRRDGNSEVYVMDADGSNQTRLTNNPAHDAGPVWSPDGSRIAFIRFRDGNEEIYSMNADGSGQTRLTDKQALDRSPAWSPDGKLIAFNSNRDGDLEIYVMSTDGSGQTRLTNVEGNDAFFGWSLQVQSPTLSASTQAGPLITVRDTAVTSGSRVKAEFSGAPGNDADWIGLFLVAAPNDAPAPFQFLEGAMEGSITLVAPSAAGEYEFRMFADWPEGGYVDIATTGSIKVIPAPTATPTSTPTPTPLPTATPTPTVTATPTQNGGIGQRSVIGLYAGTGHQSTLPFDAESSPWRLEWEGGARTVGLFTTGGQHVTNLVSNEPSGTTLIYGRRGSCYLDVVGQGEWTVTVSVP